MMNADDLASPAPLQEETSPTPDALLVELDHYAVHWPTVYESDRKARRLFAEAAARIRAASPLSESPTADAQALYERLLAEKLRWFEEAAAGDRARHSATDSATLADCLDEIRHFAPAAMHWSLNLASERLRAAHPDTQRLDWLEQDKLSWSTVLISRGNLRAAIDADRALRSAPDTPERP